MQGLAHGYVVPARYVAPLWLYLWLHCGGGYVVAHLWLTRGYICGNVLVARYICGYVRGYVCKGRARIGRCGRVYRSGRYISTSGNAIACGLLLWSFGPSGREREFPPAITTLVATLLWLGCGLAISVATLWLNCVATFVARLWLRSRLSCCRRTEWQPPLRTGWQPLCELGGSRLDERSGSRLGGRDGSRSLLGERRGSIVATFVPPFVVARLWLYCGYICGCVRGYASCGSLGCTFVAAFVGYNLWLHCGSLVWLHLRLHSWLRSCSSLVARLWLIFVAISYICGYVVVACLWLHSWLRCCDSFEARLWLYSWRLHLWLCAHNPLAYLSQFPVSPPAPEANVHYLQRDGPAEIAWPCNKLRSWLHLWLHGYICGSFRGYAVVALLWLLSWLRLLLLWLG
jgi:hypothetical protein